ncbi:hypothetical protein WMY93_000158 [Mugilogobius chulae]|uniref:Fibronectin type-III domain-containing protein n=1 Tax=Mugilogobius chulae TaxID=88201 RepID=A0AAW0Q1P6_9GOBI
MEQLGTKNIQYKEVFDKGLATHVVTGPGVAVEVHLLPLSILDSKAAKLVRQISVSLVTEAESILEYFRKLDFKSEFQGKLAEMLPLIRGGGQEEAGLAEVLKKTKRVQVVSSDELGEKVNNSEKALVFVFPSLDSKEPYLEELDNHMKRTEPNESRAEPKRWYKTKEVIDRMRSKAKVFGDFADANKDQDRKELQFLAVSLADRNHKDATIYLYEDGFQSCDNFELPPKPSRVTLGRVTENSVSVQFSAPSDGAENVCRYRVEFCEEGQEQWKQQEQKEAGEVTVTGLIPNTEYRVRVRAVTEVGLGPAAPHICFKTAPATTIQRFIKDRPSGSGKTSLINAMINYILGEGFQVDFSLTIIDTPEFGDMKRDAEIKQQIYDLFNDFGITDIHAVCFVLPSSFAGLTPTQQYALDSALSFWGKDVSENIRILVTFADDQTPPPVLQTLTEAKVPCPKTEDGLPVHFRFNNSALFVQSDTDTTETLTGTWEHKHEELLL